MSAHVPPVSAKMTRLTRYKADREGQLYESESGVDYQGDDDEVYLAAEVDRVLAERDAQLAKAKQTKAIWCMHCLLDIPVVDAADAIKKAKAHELVCDQNPLLQETRALREALAQTWRDIETAPKDGQILGWCPIRSEARILHWDTEEFHNKPKPHWASYGFLFGKIAERADQPTHWMPLPASPGVRPAETEETK